MSPDEARSWVDVEPIALAREKEAMAAAAPDMAWREQLEFRSRSVVGWEGKAPSWGGERTAPDGLETLLDGRRLVLRIYYPEAFPMVPAEIVPLDPRPPMEVRGFQQWHVNPDGSLCTVQSAYDWRPGSDTAAELVLKASGWFIEYLLLAEGRIERMTEQGIGIDTSLDALIAGPR